MFAISRAKFAKFAVAAALAWAASSIASAQGNQTVRAHNVVLVHGAWADGSSWSEVIARLQAAGLHVTAVQNPLTTLSNSVAETRRVVAQQDGPTLLVAHSWGGTVISQVGTDPKVTGLVYVAARAPDADEDFVALSAKFPTGPVLYAEQQPTAATLFAGRTTEAAWHAKPSWYAVSKHDETINPDLERFLAARMRAITVELDAGHLSLVSHAKEVADLIIAAARGDGQG
ncbi:MAG: alpha/beta hydrolase [Mesorhizobium sp.]|nr:MAG: alpha/beta hydrolase [Mesorhizobium sp.]